MELSVCIITKNECENLKKCLGALCRYPIELVVVDTGSTDGTMKMVRNYTDCVYRFDWCDNFAEARNYAISKATYNTILVLDSDEYVTEMDIPKLINQIGLYSDRIGRIERRNYVYYGEEIRSSIEYVNRLFDRRYFQYEGRVHEQLVRTVLPKSDGNCADASIEIKTYRTGIKADHSGYLLNKEEKRKKAERNIKLLQQMVLDEGENPYFLYQLGKSCYMSEDYQAAANYFGRALEFDLDERLEYVVDMVETYGYALVNSGQAEMAMGFEGLIDTFGKYSDFRFLMGIIYMNNEMYPEAVRSYEEAVALGNARMTGADSFLAYYNAGVICECLNHIQEAIAYYNKAADYQPAKARLEALK